MRVIIPVLISTALVLSGAVVNAAEPGRPSPVAGGGGVLPDVVARAQRTLLAAQPPAPGAGRALTVQLRDVFRARPRLDAASRASADALLTRPSDPAGGSGEASWDPAAPRASACTPAVCVHYVTTTGDAPPLHSSVGGVPDWVQRNLDVSQAALSTIVDQLGYRAPAADLGAGGTAQFDVYLADIGDAGLYGYCVPERRVAGERRRASSFCVFDEDFAEFPTTPDANLRVTAAHEIFHAVQFNLDFTEDPWMLEATSTWMEERLADDVDDNRQYLPAGQLGRRRVPLDRWSGDLGPYGNWIFFEHLSERYGVDAVRRIWSHAEASTGRRDDYSVRAVRRFVEQQGASFPAFYASFVQANLRPGQSYREGAAYRKARPDRSVRLSARRPRWRDRRIEVPHLSGQVVKLAPTRSLRGRRIGLRLSVDGAPPRSAPVVRVLVVKRSGKVVATSIRLDRRGRGHRRVSFAPRSVRRVLVVLANASTRYDCGAGGLRFACHGEPRDDDQTFDLTATVVR